jgi:hypothetical protein
MHVIKIHNQIDDTIVVAIVDACTINSGVSSTTFQISWKRAIIKLHEERPNVGFPLSEVLRVLREEGWQIIICDAAVVAYY